MTTADILGLVAPSLPKAWDGLYDESNVLADLSAMTTVPAKNGPVAVVAKLDDGRGMLNGI
jgi:hypothetical protein